MKNWHELTPSQFPWERDALEFVKQRFPASPAHRAWTNFEFIAGDGSINEVDLLAITPRGMFLVEIKGWPERIEGDQGTWYRITDGRRDRAEDNPLRLANLKAKRLKSLLEVTAGSRRKSNLPFIAPLVFLSHPEVQPRLDKAARLGVTVRDATDGEPNPGGLPGVVESLTRITSDDRAHRLKPLGMRDAELISALLEQAGVRESRRHRRIGDYDVHEVIDEGPGYQEYAARHASLPDTERRIRIFTSSSGLERTIALKAAKREFRVMDPLEHPGILSPREYVEHELGPALIYDREPCAITLDHYLAVYGDRLDFEQRLILIRSIAEALAYAHGRGVVHRALAPRSILVCDPSSRHPRIRIRDWHTVQRAEIAESTGDVTQTEVLESLVPEATELYLAPESTRSRTGEHLDVFSLGAIAFHILAGKPPWSSLIERQAHLDEHGGLDIGAVVDGAAELQRVCVLTATSSQVSERTRSVRDFLAELDEIESELTEPETGEEIDPTTAGKGDTLLDYKIEARLGSGASSVAYLITEDGENRVLKVAIDPTRNESLRAEAEALAKVRDPGVVPLLKQGLQIGGHEAIVIGYAGEETLAERLKRDGPLGLELLERLGEDLLRAASALEEKGVYHRDIKPANIGIGRRGRSNQLRLMLFDFSLSHAPLDAIKVGTPAYLDPFLNSPSRGRFDLHAERFAVAMTLHEMATGQLPRWGDGLSDPAVIDVDVTIEPELLGSVSESLTDFFERALARSTKDRFDTSEDMLRAWRDAFRGAATSAAVTEHDEATEDEPMLRSAGPSTPVRELGLSPRALNALERAGIANVSSFLETSEFDLRSLPGVGAATRGELVAVRRKLDELVGDDEAPDVQALDLLVRQLIPRRSWEEADLWIVRTFLGLNKDVEPWMDLGSVAVACRRDVEDVETVLGRARERWGKSLPSVSRLRDEIAEMLDREGGLLPSAMLEEGVLARRGAAAVGVERVRFAAASARAALEAEARREKPRFAEIRVGKVVVAVLAAIGDRDAARRYLKALGERARLLVSDGPVDQVRAVDELDEVAVPSGLPTFPRARLVRLAAAIEPEIEVNDRGELYPVGMDAELALRRIAGSLWSAKGLSLEELEQRLRARFLHAGPTPGREAIDRVLADYGMDWNTESARYLHRSTVLATSHRSSNLSATLPSESGASFRERLDRSRDRFLALTARHRLLAAAERTLEHIPRVTAVALDAALIDHMKAIAAEKHANWEAVLQLDESGPDGRNWRILVDLAAAGAERLRDQLLSTPGTVLASRPGLLARYGQLSILEEVRRKVDDPSEDTDLKGLWLLVPTSDGRPMIAGTPLPVIDENEWARVPPEFLDSKA